MKLNYYLNDEINCYYYLNVQIIIKSRGLHRALGRVIARALGTEVSGNADEALSVEGRQHLHVNNGQLHLLLRMLSMWIMSSLRR